MSGSDGSIGGTVSLVIKSGGSSVSRRLDRSTSLVGGGLHQSECVATDSRERTSAAEQVGAMACFQLEVVQAASAPVQQEMR